MLNFMGIAGFQQGGPVTAVAPSSLFATATRPDTSVDAGKINQQFATLNDNFAQMQRAIFELARRPVQVNIDQPNSRRISDSASVQRTDVQPRRLQA